MNMAFDPATRATWQRLAGTVIADRYRLDALLGVGSQGMVWKAHNLALDLPVAVKLIHPSSELGAEMALNRLFREARAAATLGHPGIVRIFDFGRTADGLSYLAMELLQGISLGRHLQEAPKLSPELAVRLILPIADALSAAHAQGIVHRDVKPDNILLSVSAGQMQPKLLDFGIARVADGQTLTQAGCVVGTPDYLPPEQARGLYDVDARSDVWALCATLYECVTGVVPFPAPTWIDVLRRILEEEPEPIETYGINDPDLWHLIRKGLAKQPDQRWSSMQEFACAASRWLLSRKVSCDICGTSVESRWLRPPSVAKLASGETVNGIAWWDDTPPPCQRRKLTMSRHQVMAFCDVSLCILAAVAVIRMGTPVQPLAPEATPGLPTAQLAAALPLQLPEVVPLQSANATAQPNPANEAPPVHHSEPVRAVAAAAGQGNSDGATHGDAVQQGSAELRVATDEGLAALALSLTTISQQTGSPTPPGGASRVPRPAARHAAQDKPGVTSARDDDLMAAY